MLANTFDSVRLGSFDKAIHLAATSKISIVDFIAQELAHWRDFSDRPDESAEPKLTASLCEFLNSAAYLSAEWNHISFRTETPDEAAPSRTIDLSVKPLACEIIIGNKRHTIFQALFPIECKRLPTPKGNNRDAREYVVTDKSTTGGIQRFKLGHHGAEHEFAAMIGYVQTESFSYWLKKINGWIGDLAVNAGKPWSRKDTIKKIGEDASNRWCLMSSDHERARGLENISLRHLWVDMGGTN